MARRLRSRVARFAEGGEVEKKADDSDDLPMGITKESVSRNVSATRERAEDLSLVKEYARSHRANLRRDFERGLISKEDLEKEFNRPLLGSTVPQSMLRQAMRATPEDVTERLRGAQRISESSPSMAHQMFLSGLHLRDDREKAEGYAETATERQAGKTGPVVAEAARRRALRRGFAEGGLVKSKSSRGDGCCTKGHTKGKMY